MMSHWCNYSCEYCGVPVFFKRSSSRGPQYHAFDYYPVEKWIEGFRKFPQKDINLTVTGGEPFLDNKNFPNFDKSKVYLTSTFHSSQTSFDDYRKRLLRIREAGFQFATVSIVLAPENLPNAEHALTTLESDGFPVIGGAMQPAGRYMDRLERTPEERQLLRRFGNPFAIHRVVVNPKTEGDPYYHPAFSYRLHPDGSVNVACIGARQHIFTAGLPELPRHAVACPVQHCEGCPEMVRAIVNVPYYNRPLSIYHPDEALQENIELRESYAMAPTHSTTSFLTSFEAHWDRAAAVPPGSFVPLSNGASRAAIWIYR